MINGSVFKAIEYVINRLVERDDKELLREWDRIRGNDKITSTALEEQIKELRELNRLKEKYDC